MMNEALNYFQEDSGFESLFILFKKKYESLGRIGGTVKVDGFNETELIAIARFFGITLVEVKKKGTISLIDFEKQLKRTRFSNIDLKELLEAYFKEPLISNKERKRLELEQQERFVTRLIDEFPRLEFWLEYLKRRTPDTFWIYRLMQENPEDFKLKAYYLERAFRCLPQHFERLPLFSQRITRDPHAFDMNTNLGKLLLHLLAVNLNLDESVVLPVDTESINNLLFEYRLLRDDITNYVTCANLLAERESELHPLWVAAVKTESVMNIPLRELLNLTRIYPKNEEKKVWIVENSGVYSSILDEVPSVPLICTHGQFKLAALEMMDLLVDEGVTLYYASDLDPEGLGMAEKLLLRYPEHVKLWKMDVKDYENSLAEARLSEERLKKLSAIGVSELTPVVNEMRKRKQPGYQEALVKEMVEELKSLGY